MFLKFLTVPFMKCLKTKLQFYFSGMTPFARPSYPGLGVPGNSFGGLGSLGIY